VFAPIDALAIVAVLEGFFAAGTFADNAADGLLSGGDGKNRRQGSKSCRLRPVSFLIGRRAS
jgi:hypothetical protein